MLEIGSVKLKHGLFLAPLAGVSDRAFRKVCRDHGAECTVSEMISAKGLHYNDTKTARLAAFSAEEAPFFIQIFGSDPEIMAESAYKLATNNYKACQNTCLPTGIDINMGCPVPKIAGNGDGSALMKNPKLAGEIVRAVSGAVDLPVTVKIRAGFDKNHVCAPQYAEMAERAGLAAVCIHGRTREQMYTPPVDLDVIKDTVSAVGIPVIGNGEIMSVDDALKMKDYTGCSSLMIARGALGNPFLFAQIKDALEGKEIREIGYKERIETAMSHLDLMIADKGERTGLLEARKHIAWYIKGMPGAPAIRDRVNRIEDYETMRAVLQEQLNRS